MQHPTESFSRDLTFAFSLLIFASPFLCPEQCILVSGLCLFCFGFSFAIKSIVFQPCLDDPLLDFLSAAKQDPVIQGALWDGHDAGRLGGLERIRQAARRDSEESSQFTCEASFVKDDVTGWAVRNNSDHAYRSLCN